MALSLRPTRVRLTTAQYYGRPPSSGLTSLAQGNGITLTPNPTVGVGTVALGTLTGPWTAGNFNINSRNSVSVFNVVAYGADATGVADSTAAIQSAITAAAAATPRGVVYFPNGTFKTNGGYNLDGLDGLGFMGAGTSSTVISLAHATNDLFYTQNTATYDIVFSGFTVDASVVRTGGWVFHVDTAWNGTGNVNYFRFKDIVVLNQMNGFWFSHFNYCWMDNVIGSEWETTGGTFLKAGQTAAGATNQGSGLYIQNCIAQGTAGAFPFVGAPTLSYGYWFEDCQGNYLINSEAVMLLESDLVVTGNIAGLASGFHFFTGSIFDATKNSHCVSVVGAGLVTKLQFTGCWFAAAGRPVGGGGSLTANGCKITPTTLGDILFTGCKFFDTNGSGLYIDPAGVSNTAVNVSGCDFEACGLGAQAGNDSGIYVNASPNLSGPNITGCHESLSQTYSIISSADSNELYLYANNFETAPSFGVAPKGQYFNAALNQVFSPNVGIGTTTPIYPLHTVRTVGATAAIDSANVFSQEATAADANDRRAVLASVGATHVAGTVGSLTPVYSYGLINGVGGTTTDYRNYIADVNVTAGTVTNRYAFQAINASGAGTLHNQYGFYCPALTKGDTVNYAFYSIDGNTPSVHAGKYSIGQLNAPTREFDLYGTQRFRGIAAPAVSEANSATMYFDTATNTLKASLNGSAYVNVIGSAGLTGSGTAGNISYWSAATVVAGAANIYIDAANHRLGIQTAPAYPLDVAGDVNLTTGSVIRVNALRAIVSDAANDITLIGSDLPAGIGANSTAVGALALTLSTSTGNTAVGRNSLGATTTGTDNVALGLGAGITNTTGADNLFLGTNADASAGNLQRATAIGHDAVVAANDSLVLGDASVKVGIHTSTPAQALDVNGAVATRHLDIALVNGLNSDIALTASSWIRVTGPTGAFSLGGFTLGTDGRHLSVFNTTAQAMTIVNEDVSSTAANRITTLTGGNVVLAARTSAASFIYEDTTDRWILVSYN